MKKTITDTAMLVVGILIASYIWYKWQQKLDAKADQKGLTENSTNPVN